MGIFDNLASRLNYNTDDDYDNEYDDDVMDEEEEEEEHHTRHGFFGSRSKSSRQDEEEEDDSYYNPPSQGRTGLRSGSRSGGAQLTPVNRGGRQNPAPSGKTQVRVIKPSSFDQARQITDTLLVHRTVILNLEGLDVNTAQRIVDFASGSCYALHGNFMKISHFIIVITPEDVDIAGDISGGHPNGVSGILANAAAQGGMNGMGGMNGINGMGNANDGSANPFVNNTINMGSAY